MAQRQLATVSGETAAHAAVARSRAYRSFSAAFGYPEGELLAQIRAGSLADALAEALGSVEPLLAAELARAALADAGEADALAVEHSRLFDVGPSGPPCPLHGGLWIGDRMRSMEEVLRFYQHFDLGLDGASRELPDHLTVELEFLHFLSFRQAEAWRDGADPGSYRRAERDFLARHPGRWLPKLCAALEREQATPFYVELARALDALLACASAELGSAPASDGDDAASCGSCSRSATPSAPASAANQKTTAPV